MRMRARLLIFLFLWAPITYGMAESNPEVFSIDSFVRMALVRNPLGKAAGYDVEKAELDIAGIKLRRYVPSMRLGLHTGLVPEARGDVFFSPDNMDDLDGLGPFYRFNLSFALPLYTFGRTSSALKASNQGLQLQQSREENVKEKIRLEAIRSYWMVSSSRKARELAEGLRRSYTELEAEVRKRLEDEESDVDDSDLLEVKTFAYTIEENFHKSVEINELSVRAFNALLLRSLDRTVSTRDEVSPLFELENAEIEKLQKVAEKHRPDLMGFKAAVNGLHAKIDLAKSNRYPLLFLEAGLGFAHAGNRTDQTNPFVVDNFNYRRVQAAIGIQWDPNLLMKNIEVRKAQAELHTTEEKLSALRAEIGLDVSRAFLEVKRNESLLRAAHTSLKSAGNWLKLTMDNWDLGIGEVRRLLRAYEAYYRLQGIEIERIFQYNVSLAKLAHTLGNTMLYLEWVQDGSVTFKTE